MDTLSFVSALTGSLAWPCTTLALVVLMRKPIGDLLLELRKLKWKEFEAEFGRELDQAREALALAPNIESSAASSLADKNSDRNHDFFRALANLSPRSVVLEAWRQVESAINKRSEYRQLKSAIPPSAASVGQTLVKSGILDDAEFQVFSILRNLRNRAAHDTGFEISKDDSIEYALMARRLMNTVIDRGNGEVQK